MKTRQSFVSNSSTTSFLMYGMSSPTCQDDWPEDVAKDKIYGDAGLECFCSEGDGYYIGRSWDTVKDDETGAQFKAAIQTALDLLFPEQKPVYCTTHEEAYRDG